LFRFFSFLCCFVLFKFFSILFLRDFVEIETMAMGAATATNGDATPVDIPGRRLYANGGNEKKNGASLHHKHQHSSRSSDDDEVPDGKLRLLAVPLLLPL
jgi:hypothetical protein